MRQITDFSSGWLMNATAPDTTEYAQTKVNLPFIHKAEDFSHLTIHKEFTAGKTAGRMLRLASEGLTGHATVYCNGKKLASLLSMQSPFSVLISDNQQPGDEFTIRIEINPRPRSDGRFVIGRISLVDTGEYRFNTEGEVSSGVHAECSVVENGGALTIIPDVVNATNYDIVTAVLKDELGDTISVKSMKATAEKMVMDFASEDIYRAPRFPKRTLDVSLLRDTALLDSVIFPIGLCSDKVENFSFYRNSEKMKLRGISLADLSSVKKDLALMKEPGFNCVRLTGLPAKSNIFSLLDDMGAIAWYDLPYTGSRSDFAMLRELLRRYAFHPSFRFVCCDAEADDDYVKEFTKTVRSTSKTVYPVMKYELGSGRKIPDYRPDIIDVAIRFTSVAQQASDIDEAFARLESACPDAAFSISFCPPSIGGLEGLTELTNAVWHRKAFSVFAKRRNILCLFAGNIRSGDFGNGLYNEGELTLAGEMYKTQYSGLEHLRIEADDSIRTGTKFAEFVVYSNNPNFKLLINSHPAKNPVITEITNNIYLISELKLDSKENLIEISAGEECDNITAIRGK